MDATVCQADYGVKRRAKLRLPDSTWSILLPGIFPSYRGIYPTYAVRPKGEITMSGTPRNPMDGMEYHPNRTGTTLHAGQSRAMAGGPIVSIPESEVHAAGMESNVFDIAGGRLILSYKSQACESISFPHGNQPLKGRTQEIHTPTGVNTSIQPLTLCNLQKAV